MLQTLKITVVPLLLAFGLLALASCNDTAKARPIVTGYDAAGKAQKCPGLADNETCPDESDEVKAFTRKCTFDGRDVVRCKDCSILCTSPPPPEGAGSAL